MEFSRSFHLSCWTSLSDQIQRCGSLGFVGLTMAGALLPLPLLPSDTTVNNNDDGDDEDGAFLDVSRDILDLRAAQPMAPFVSVQFSPDGGVAIALTKGGRLVTWVCGNREYGQVRSFSLNL